MERFEDINVGLSYYGSRFLWVFLPYKYFVETCHDTSLPTDVEFIVMSVCFVSVFITLSLITPKKVLQRKGLAVRNIF